MPQFSKKISTLLIVALTVASVLVLKNVVLNDTFREERVIKARSKGRSKADIQITEFIDFQCPACAYGATRLQEAMEKNPGKIHLKMRYFPLSMHQHAMTASLFAECAALQKKFWLFHDEVLKQQNQWKRLKDVESIFFDIAGDIGLNESQLKTCIADQAIKERIFADKEEGRVRGVKSTPSYFINDEMFVGAHSLVNKLNTLLDVKI